MPIVMEAIWRQRRDHDLRARASTLLNGATEGLSAHTVGSRHVTTAEFSPPRSSKDRFSLTYKLPGHIETSIDLHIGELAAADWDIAGVLETARLLFAKPRNRD